MPTPATSSGATDIDDDNSSLTISSVEGDSDNVDSSVDITLSYNDADGVGQNQNVSLTVNSDGSYSIAAFDLDDLPPGTNATGSFTYTVADDSGAESSKKPPTSTSQAPTTLQLSSLVPFHRQKINSSQESPLMPTPAASSLELLILTMTTPLSPSRP